jgi:hypothetical protein
MAPDGMQIVNMRPTDGGSKTEVTIVMSAEQAQRWAQLAADGVLESRGIDLLAIEDADVKSSHKYRQQAKARSQGSNEDIDRG